MTAKFQVGDQVQVIRPPIGSREVLKYCGNATGNVAHVLSCEIFDKIFYLYLLELDGSRYTKRSGPFYEDELAKRSI